MYGNGSRARLVVVALEAALLVELSMFLFCGDPVWVMTRRTPELSAAYLIASTRTHLFHMADDLRVAVSVCSIIAYKNRPDVLQAISGAEVVIGSPIPQAASLSGKMALVTDRFAFRRFQIGWIDDDVGRAVISIRSMMGDMAAGWTMASFTTDGLFQKGGCAVGIRMIAVRCCTSGMTHQAAITDHTAESWMELRVVARRQIPPLFAAVPGDGRDGEHAIILDQITATTDSRSECVLDLDRLIVDDSVFVAEDFVVHDLFTVFFDAVLAGICCLEFIVLIV